MMMDRRRRVLRRDLSPVVQQPFQNNIGVNGALGVLCVSCGGVEGRVVGSVAGGRGNSLSEAGRWKRQSHQSRANLYDVSAELATLCIVRIHTST